MIYSDEIVSEKAMKFIIFALFYFSHLSYGEEPQVGPKMDLQNSKEVPKDGENKEEVIIKKKNTDMQEDLNEPWISQKYKRGEYLIYDCKSHYFACVNSISYEICEEKRDSEKSDGKRFLTCVPLKQFKTQKLCFTEQYKQIHRPKNKLFCINQDKKANR